MDTWLQFSLPGFILLSRRTTNTLGERTFVVNMYLDKYILHSDEYPQLPLQWYTEVPVWRYTISYVFKFEMKPFHVALIVSNWYTSITAFRTVPVPRATDFRNWNTRKVLHVVYLWDTLTSNLQKGLSCDASLERYTRVRPYTVNYSRKNVTSLHIILWRTP